MGVSGALKLTVQMPLAINERVPPLIVQRVGVCELIVSILVLASLNPAAS
jgi:hypothetical protein